VKVKVYARHKNPLTMIKVHPTAFIGPGVQLDSSYGLTIEEDVWILDESTIFTHDHNTDTREVHGKSKIIKKGATIGARAIILQSCDYIGKKSVISAGSVVTKSVPDGEMWGGVPAKKIRLSNEVISKDLLIDFRGVEAGVISESDVSEKERAKLYSAFDGNTAELEVCEFIYALVRLTKPKYVVETGTWHGILSYFICKAIEKNGLGQLDTIEIDQESVEISQRRLSIFPFANVICKNSIDFIPREKIDILILDSSISMRMKELRAYSNRIDEDTLIILHDTEWSNMKSELDKMVNGNFVEVMAHFKTPRGLTLLKPGKSIMIDEEEELLLDLEKDPTNLEVIMNLGEIYEEKSDFKTSIHYYSLINNWESCYKINKCHDLAGSGQDVINESYKKGLKSVEDFSGPLTIDWSLYGMKSAIKLKEWKRGVKISKMKSFDHIDYCFSRAWLCYGDGSLEEAGLYYSLAIVAPCPEGEYCDINEMVCKENLMRLKKSVWKRHKNRPKTTCIVSMTTHGKRTADALGIPCYRWGDRELALNHDRIYCIGLFWQHHDIVKEAGKRGIEVIAHWIGGDVIRAEWADNRGNPEIVKTLSSISKNFVAHERLIPELEGIGVTVDGVLRTLPDASYEYEGVKIEDKIIILSYIPFKDSVFYGVRYVIKMAEMLPNAEIILVGNKEELEMELPTNCRVLGYLDRDELNVYMSKCHIYVRATMHDSLPLMMTESFQRGKYVISNYPYDGAFHCKTPEEAVKTVKNILSGDVDHDLKKWSDYYKEMVDSDTILKETIKLVMEK